MATKVNKIDIVSTNSSTATLDNGETYTGSWVDTLKYGYLNVMTAVKTDQNGVLYIDFSPDGTNVDSTLTYQYQTSLIFPPHRLSVTRQFFRVRFENNSGSNQTYFRLQTSAGDMRELSVSLNGIIAPTYDAIVVRSVESELDIAQGKYQGYSLVNKFGRNADIDTAGNEDIWQGGGFYTGFPTGSAETVEVFSSSTDDDEGGSGAEKIHIYGLDANYDFQDEEITLNGTSAVATTNTYTRVFRGVVTQSANGANTAFNAGTITCRHTSTTANVFFIMAAGRNQTQVACYTIPNGFTGYLRRININVLKTQTATVTGNLWCREFGKAPVLVRPFSASNSNSWNENIYGGTALPEKTDAALRVLTCSANNTTVSGLFDLLLVRDAS